DASMPNREGENPLTRAAPRFSGFVLAYAILAVALTELVVGQAGNRAAPWLRFCHAGRGRLRREPRFAWVFLLWQSQRVDGMVGPDGAMRCRSPVARRRYIELAERAAHAAASESDPLVVLETGTAWLELFHVSALTWEYFHQHRIGSLDQLQPYAAGL